MPEAKIDCPFCQKEKHLYINFQKGLYHCFRCLKGGRISELRDLVPQLFRESNTSPSLKRSQINREELKPLIPENKLYWRYAKDRKALFFLDNLHVCYKYPGYLIIGLPLLEPLKGQEFFFGRKIALSGPRYKYFLPTKGIIAKSFKGKVDKALIVEGFFDMCNTFEHIPTIALLGKGFDDKKILKIKESVGKQAIISLDADALSEGVNLVYRLAGEGIRARVIHSSIIKDPGEDNSFVKNNLKGNI